MNLPEKLNICSYVRRLCFGTAFLFCLCCLNRDFFSYGLGHALRQFVHQTDAAVVDPYLLRCCAGVFLRMLSGFHSLDEDPQDLSSGDHQPLWRYLGGDD